MTLNFKNDYLIKGILFLLAGVIFILWSFDIVIFAMSSLVFFVLSLGIMYYGYNLSKYSRFGYIVILLGFILGLKSLGLFIPLKFVFGLIFLILGLYFLIVKLGMFVSQKGVFKDSRESAYIKEKFSSVTIKNTSPNLCFVNVNAFFSNIVLDFTSSQIVELDVIDFDIVSRFSQIRIISNPSWNIILNEKVIRKNDGYGKTVRIRCRNLFESLEIE